MEILELAKTLGTMIKNDERVVRMNAAEAAYNADADLLGAIAEYNAQKQALSALHTSNANAANAADATATATAAAAADSDAAVRDVEQRINELYHKITENPVYSEFNEAQELVSILLNQVNSEIMFQITGERQCSGSCESCGGCH